MSALIAVVGMLVAMVLILAFALARMAKRGEEQAWRDAKARTEEHDDWHWPK